MIKIIIKHLLVIPAFLFASLYGLLRRLYYPDNFKSALKNAAAMLFSGILFSFRKEDSIIYNDQFSIDFTILKITPFSKRSRIIIEIYPLYDFRKNKKCSGRWTLPVKLNGMKKNHFSMQVRYPFLVYEGRSFQNEIESSALEDGKHIGFLRLKLGKGRLFSLHRLFKFYRFRRKVKKRERTPLDFHNIDTYSFLFSKPFSKNVSNFTSVWNELDPFAHIDNFNIYAFNFISILSRNKLPPGSWILDLGAGSCWTSEWLSKLGYNVIGYDISLQTLSVGNQRINKYRDSRKFPKTDPVLPDFLTVCGDSTVLPFAEFSFDAIVVIETLHHIPEYTKVIREGFRVLKKNGRLVLLEPGSYHSETPEALITMKKQAIYEGSLDRKLIRRSALESGFRVKEYLMPINTYMTPRNDRMYYKNYIMRLYGNIYEWFIRYLEIPLNMDGNIFFIFEKPA